MHAQMFAMVSMPPGYARAPLDGYRPVRKAAGVPGWRRPAP